MKQAALALGVEVLKEDQNFHSNYDSTRYTAKQVFSYGGGKAAIIQQKDGSYEMTIDNFCNPIVDKLGKDCCLLGREYSKKLVEKQAMLMGGVITASSVNSLGEVQMVISL